MAEIPDIRRNSQGVRRRWALLAAIAALLLLAPAGAEEAAEAAPAAAAPPEVPEPPPFADEFGRQTPRRSVKGYLVAARAGDWVRAAQHLQLTGLPPSERAAGPRLARHLKTVLDRTLWVELDRLSDEPEGAGGDGLPTRRDRVGVIETEGGPVDVFVDRVPRGDGARIWKFSSATVRRIPDLYGEFGLGPLGELLPDIFFESLVLEVQLWQWIALLILVFVAYVVSWLAARAAIAAARPLVARSRTEFDDKVLDAMAAPLRLIVAVTIFSITMLSLGLSVPAERLFVNVMKGLGVVAFTWVVLRMIDLFGGVAERRLEQRGQRSATSVVPLARNTFKGIVIAIAVLAALDSIGFDVTALIAGLGVGGLAFALAAQKTLENLFGGATLIADRPVQVGDFCRFGDKVGVIEEIGMRSTRVRTLDRTVVTVPNAEFSSLQLENFTRRDKIWYHPRIGLLYDTTPDQLRYVLVEIRKMLYAHPRVDEDPARARFVNFGSSSLDIDIFAYVLATDYSDYLEVAEDLNLRIMDIVKEGGTSFAFPSTTAYLAKDGGVDVEKTRAAEEAVRGWRERGELFLPGFPREKIEELDDTLDYPNRGSALRDDK